MPKNISEFAKHMDARSRTKTISDLCVAVVGTALAAVVIYLFIDFNLTLTKYILCYAVLMIVLAAAINRERSKYLVAAYEVFVFMVLGIIFSDNIRQICGNQSKVIFAYLPIVVHCVLGFFLYRCVWDFHEAWNSYQSSGIVPTGTTHAKGKSRTDQRMAEIPVKYEI